MLSTVQVVTPPAIEPVSLDLAKQHCRIDSNADDSLIPAYIAAARTMAEAYLSRALITRTLLWVVTPQGSLRPDRSRLRGVLELPRAPVQSITSVAVMDVLGNTTAIQAAALPVVPPAVLLGYRADLLQEPARLAIGADTPLAGGGLVRNTEIENVQITFVAGYGAVATAVPQPIIHAILLIIGFLYEHRGDSDGDLPKAAEWLLDPYRMMFVA